VVFSSRFRVGVDPGWFSAIDRAVRRLLLCSLTLLTALSCSKGRAPAPPSSSPATPTLRGPALEARVQALLTRAKVPGLGLAIIENGEIAEVNAYGLRDVASGAPMQEDTVMYAASWTKLAFATLVMQLVEARKLELDRPLAEYLPQPLPAYDYYRDLEKDERWRKLTARMLLSHSGGFPNFRSFNDDGRLDFKVDPGTRYAYSGEGINLLQFVLETGLKQDVGKLLHERFEHLHMSRSALVWRDDWGGNVSTGYAVNGTPEPHHRKRTVLAAGSLDTTISDFAAFMAAFMRGEGLSKASRDEILNAQLPITGPHQFPTFEKLPDEPLGLSAGLGVVLFAGPQGRGFFKGGHDDWTDNTLVCLEKGRRCVLLLSNSARAQAIFPALVRAVLGETGIPWKWEYSDPTSPGAVE
jgi:CubicO group peptidase (beta-lactamase class C family)